MLEQEKIEENREFVEFDLRDCINAAILDVKAFLGDIEIKQETEEIIVSADFEMLESAISNILTNAIKYSKTKTIEIKAKPEGDFVKINIIDFGIGIEEKYIDRIFEKFYRPDKTRSREFGGNGLGLSIAKEIIELHKGKITLHSEVNKGCDFEILLPKGI